MSADPFLRHTLALSLAKNMGPVSFQKLLSVFGEPEKIWKAADRPYGEDLRGVRVSRTDLDPKKLLILADRELEKAAEYGVRVIPYGDKAYPEALKAIYDPPTVLYVKGDLPRAGELCVAVVGSRIASIYGKKMARTIASDLARAGAAVISGMALGIDGAAHEGALEGGGRTFAVLGGGIAKPYPPEHKKLSEKIAELGGLISEYPVQMTPRPQYFPIRNRLVSAFSKAVLVIEAKEKSGALITADLALEQGRDVFALPGNADALKSSGANKLIKEGAKLVTSAADILEEYEHALPGRRKKPKSDLSPEESSALDLLEDGPLQLEELLEKSQMPLQKLMTLLSYLEMKGEVRSLPGKIFQRTR